jgi:hypothetical protein
VFAGRNHRAGAGLWIVGDGTAQTKSPRDDPRIVPLVLCGDLPHLPSRFRLGAAAIVASRSG